MPRPRQSKTNKKSKQRRPGKKKKCRFCRGRRGPVDYKDIMALRKLTTLQGKIFSRKRSGNCTTHQRQLKTAVKRSRYLALM